jgi:hypothetical protein
MNPMPDQEINAVRQARHEISAACGHEVDRVAAYYLAVEDELRRSGEFRFVELPKQPARNKELVHPAPGHNE